MGDVLISSEEFDLLASMRWQPIETAPRDGTRILLYLGEDSIEIGYWEWAHERVHDCWWIDAHGPPQWTWPVKAWMHLPNPPDTTA